MAKVQITIDDRLLERADAYADANYTSRSGLISLSLTNFLNANETMLLIKDMSLAMRKIADKGQVDHETMEKLEDFVRFANMIQGEN